MNRALFRLGQIVATPGALEAFQRNEAEFHDFLMRHQTGDWGELCKEDREENELGVREGYRILSAYRLTDKTKFYVITEWDRSVTTFLLPAEY